MFRSLCGGAGEETPSPVSPLSPLPGQTQLFVFTEALQTGCVARWRTDLFCRAVASGYEGHPGSAGSVFPDCLPATWKRRLPQSEQEQLCTAVFLCAEKEQTEKVRYFELEARLLVAGCAATPVEVLDVLFMDDNPVVRMAVAANPGVSRDFIRYILHMEEDYRVKQEANNNPSLELAGFLQCPGSEAVAKQMSESDSPYDRGAAALWPGTPPEILAVLAKDGSVLVRRMLAANPRISSALLAVLSRDFMPGVRARVAAHPSASPEILAFLAGDRVLEVRAAVARNPFAPLSLLDVLTADPSPVVRAAVAGNISLSEDRRQAYAYSKESEMRAAVASGCLCLPDTLRELARDPDHKVCCAVAGNPFSPGDALAFLCRRALQWLVTGGELPAGAIPEKFAMQLSEALEVLLALAGNAGVAPALQAEIIRHCLKSTGSGTGRTKALLFNIMNTAVRTMVPACRKATRFRRVAVFWGQGAGLKVPADLLDTITFFCLGHA